MTDDKDAAWDGKIRFKLDPNADEDVYCFLKLLNSQVRGRVIRQLLQEAVFARMSTKDRTQRRSLRTARLAPDRGVGVDESPPKVRARVQPNAVPTLTEVVKPVADTQSMATDEVAARAGAGTVQSDDSFGRGRAEVNKTGASSKETDLHKTTQIQDGLGAEGDPSLSPELLTRPIPVKKKTLVNLGQMAPDSML